MPGLMYDQKSEAEWQKMAFKYAFGNKTMMETLRTEGLVSFLKKLHIAIISRPIS